MQNIIAVQEATEQQRSKVRWLWTPTGVLVLIGLGLFKVRPGWGALGLTVAALWMLLASVAYGIREGMNWGGSGVLGYGPDIRSVGLFASYRQRPTQWSLLCIYVAFLLLGGLSPWLLKLDDVEGGFVLTPLEFAFVCGPLDLCNWWIARRWGDRPAMRQAVSLWLPAMLLGQLSNWIFLDFVAAVRPSVVFPAHWWVGPLFGLGYTLILIAIHRTALQWSSRLDQAHERAETAETGRRLAEAQLAVLQAQIEPHFLYNTLATVQYLLKGEPAAADFLLTQLIRYLRLAMPSMRQYSSTLGREFELTDAYLQIARLRMGGRLSVDLDLATELEANAFPPLVLQTLVENAIKHGIEPKLGPVRIRVWAHREAGELRISVQDDGVGLGGAQTQGGGTGLQNIRERLQGIYGEQARLSIAGLPQGGVLASVTIPLEPL